MSAPSESGSLQVRRHQRVVHHQQRIVLVRQCASARRSMTRSRGLVGDSTKMRRVRGVIFAAKDCRIAGVGIAARDARALQDAREQPAGSAVQIDVGKNLIAGAQSARHRGDGGHSAGKGEAARAAFESGDLLFQNRARWIAAARVIVVAELVRVLLLKGCGLVDGRGRGTEAISGCGVELYEPASEFHWRPPSHALLQPAAAKACSRSAMMSAGDSSPTESRISPSEMPRCWRSSGPRSACVVVAGWVTSVSSPPRLSARVQSCMALIAAIAVV